LIRKKPEFQEVTREKSSVSGGWENESSPKTFFQLSSKVDCSASPKNIGFSRSIANTVDFDSLILLLGHEQSEVRISAAAALGNLGDPRAIEPLFRTCMDENSSVKIAAREALASIITRMQ
jgi:HEAT repeat protein